MAPSQAVAVEAPLREVLDAVGVFLNGCGLTRTAALLGQEAPLAMPTKEVLAEESKRLAAVLRDAEAAGSGKENVEPAQANEEEWLDELLAKALDSGVVSHAAGTNIANSLQRSLSKKVLPTADLKQGALSSAYPAAASAHGGVETVVEEAGPSGEAPQVLPPPVPVAPPVEPSQHYEPMRPAPLLVDGSPDEYRDDGDPGYRVLAISEVELLAELHEAYRAALAEVQERTRQAEGLEAAPDTAQEAPPAALPETDELELATAVVVTSPPDTGLEAPVESPPDQALGAAPEVPEAALQTAPDTSPDDGNAGDHLAMEEAERSKLAALNAPGAKLVDECSVSEGVAAAAAAAEAAAAISQISAASAGAAMPHGAVMLPPGTSWQAQVAPPVQVENVMMPHVLSNSRKKAKRRGQQPLYRYAPSGDDFYPAEMDGIVFDSFPLRVVFERDRTGFEESKEFPIQQGSIIAARYQVLNYLGSAAFSRAVHCLDLERNEMVCMKIIKNEKDFVDQSLDEIKLLKLIGTNTENVDNKHCVRLIDCFYHKEHLILVTELLRENLYEFSKWNREHGESPYFTLGRLQMVARQLLIALEYIHGLLLIHSDLKPENILIQSYSRCLVKLIDFGSSCFVDDHLSSYVQSRSYRAPEVLLGLPYGQKIDLWSLGCVIAEVWTGYVLFQNDSVQSLLARIAGIVGPFPPAMLATGRFVPNYFTQDGRLFKELEVEIPQGPDAPPPETIRRIQLLLPKRSSLRQRMRIEDECFEDFLTYLLKIDPAERPTATEALQHPWLQKGRYSDGL